jgi:D-serine deaminase-like pyridoxal phosphate-dependent protein
MLISELETAAVVIDLDVMERNLSRMAEYCRARLTIGARQGALRNALATKGTRAT